MFEAPTDGKRDGFNLFVLNMLSLMSKVSLLCFNSICIDLMSKVYEGILLLNMDKSIVLSVLILSHTEVLRDRWTNTLRLLEGLLLDFPKLMSLNDVNLVNLEPRIAFVREVSFYVWGLNGEDVLMDISRRVMNIGVNEEWFFNVDCLLKSHESALMSAIFKL
jgi:hypothetical protein